MNFKPSWLGIIVAAIIGFGIGLYAESILFKDSTEVVYQHNGKPKNEIPSIKDNGFDTDAYLTPDTVEYLLISKVLEARTMYNDGRPDGVYYEANSIATPLKLTVNPAYTGIQKAWLPVLDPNKFTYTGEHYLIRDFIVLSGPPGI